jgi:hypothetical protein
LKCPKCGTINKPEVSAEAPLPSSGITIPTAKPEVSNANGTPVTQEFIIKLVVWTVAIILAAAGISYIVYNQ